MTARQFQAKLKKFLKDHKKTQRWLAKRLNVPETTLSSWVLGLSAPKKDRRNDILATLEVLDGMPLHHDPKVVRTTKKQSKASVQKPQEQKTDRKVVTDVIETHMIVLTAFGAGLAKPKTTEKELTPLEKLEIRLHNHEVFELFIALLGMASVLIGLYIAFIK